MVSWSSQSSSLYPTRDYQSTLVSHSATIRLFGSQQGSWIHWWLKFWRTQDSAFSSMAQYNLSFRKSPNSSGLRDVYSQGTTQSLVLICIFGCYSSSHLCLAHDSWRSRSLGTYPKAFLCWYSVRFELTHLDSLALSSMLPLIRAYSV